MLYADLLDSPSLVSLLAAVGVISAATGLLARGQHVCSGRETRDRLSHRRRGRRIIAILLTSMGPFDSSFEQMMGGLRPAGSFMAGPAALAGFCLGLASIELGRGIRSALRRSAGE